MEKRKWQIKPRRLAKWLLGLVLFPFLLSFLIMLALHIPAVQQGVKNRAVSQLHKLTGAEISLQRIDFSVFGNLSLKGLCVLDQSEDTLLYAGQINVGISPIMLLRNTVYLKHLSVSDTYINLQRNADTGVYNFDFIADAFSGNNSVAVNGDSVKQASENKASWSLKSNPIFLKNIRFEMLDPASGLLVNSFLKSLSLSQVKMDFNTLAIEVKKPEVKGLDVLIETFEKGSWVSPESEPALMPDLTIGLLRFSDLSFQYIDRNLGQELKLFAGSLMVLPESLDLNNQFLAFKSFSSSALRFVMISPLAENPKVKQKLKQENEPQPIIPRLGWRLKLDEASLKQAELLFLQKTNLGKLKPVMGFPQLFNLNLAFRELIFSDDSLGIKLNNLQFDDYSGFSLKSLKASLNAGKSETNVNLEALETSKSQISFEIHSDFSLFTPFELSSNPALNVRMQPSSISMEDVQYWLPEIESVVPGVKGQDLRIDVRGALMGTLNDIAVEDLFFQANDYGKVAIRGSIQHALSATLPQISLDSIQIQLLTPEVLKVLQALGIDMPLAFPSELNVSGNVYVNWPQIKTTLMLESDFVDISLSAEAGKNVEQTFHILQLDISDFLPEKIFGIKDFHEPLQISLYASGTDYLPEKYSGSFQLDFKNLMYAGYNYKEIGFTGVYNNQYFELQSNYLADALSFDLKAKAAIQSPSSFVLSLNLKHTELMELGFMENPLGLKGRLSGIIKPDTMSWFSGNIKLEDFELVQNKHAYPLKSIELNSERKNGDYSVEIQSDLLFVSYQGSIIPPDVIKVYNHWLHNKLDGNNPWETYADSAGYFTLEARLLPSPLLFDVLMPGLKEFSGLSLANSLDLNKKSFLLSSSFENIQMNGFGIKDFAFAGREEAGNFSFKASANHFDLNEIRLYDLSLNGLAAQTEGVFEIIAHNETHQPWIKASMSIEKSDSLWKINMLPQDFILYQIPWEIPAENYVLLGKNFVFVNQWGLKSEYESLLIQSTLSGNNTLPPLQVEVRDFDFFRWSSLLQTGEDAFSGVLNASINIENFFETPIIEGDLNIRNFAFKSDTLGNIRLKLDNVSSEKMRLDMDIYSRLNELSLKGDYLISNEGHKIDLTLNIVKADLSTLEAYTFGELTDMKGQMKGNLKIKGEISKPRIEGSLGLHQAGMRVRYLNAQLNFENESMRIDPQGMAFRNFTITDSRGQRAQLNGRINTEDFIQYRFALEAGLRNFLVMDVAEGANPFFSGKAIVDGNLRINGPLEKLRIGADARLREGSNLQINIPQSNPEIRSREGVVEFVNRTQSDIEITGISAPAANTVVSAGNMELVANIEVNPSTTMKIIIDPETGDYLESTGGGVLSFGIAPGGQMSLTGRYEISQGVYEMTFYEFINRSFSIQKGSSITWTGDLMNADVDITAQYSLRTSAMELFEGPVSGGSAFSAQLRQQYPFQVLLYMKDKLMKPEISFAISMPQEARGALDGQLFSRIQQLNTDESELNKQVFSLLLFESFLAHNPFASMGQAQSMSSTARSSASRILTNELNRLSKRYIQGLDLNFGVESYEDFSGGEAQGRTDFQFELSKEFFNRRLKVQMGGNINVEGAEREDQQLNDLAGDFIIEYLVTPDGSVKAKAFRQNQYKGLLDGMVTETGLSIGLIRNYNRFRELFYRKQKDTEIIDE